MTGSHREGRKYRANGEEIELIHIPTAHSTGDTLVHFKGSGVISGGDLFAITRYPIVDFDGGGRVQGMIAGLNQIIALSDPSRVKAAPTSFQAAAGFAIAKTSSSTVTCRSFSETEFRT